MHTHAEYLKRKHELEAELDALEAEMLSTNTARAKAEVELQLPKYTPLVGRCFVALWGEAEGTVFKVDYVEPSYIQAHGFHISVCGRIVSRDTSGVCARKYGEGVSYYSTVTGWRTDSTWGSRWREVNDSGFEALYAAINKHADALATFTDLGG